MSKKTLFSILVITLLVTSAIFIFKQRALKKPTNKKPDRVTVLLDWTPNTNHTGLYVAKDKGYYKAQNLDVDIIQPSEGEAARIVATGKVDFAVSAAEEVTFARAKDIPLVSIAAIMQHNTSTFASLKSSGIRTARDFEGKRYGGWGSPIGIATQKILMKKAGGDYNKIEQITIGTSDFLATLGRDADIEWIFYGWEGIQAKQSGVELSHIWLKDIDPVLDYYTPVIITNEKHVKEQKDLVRRFIQATAQGYEFSIIHPRDAAKILEKAAPELNAKLVEESQMWLSPRYKADAAMWGIQKENVWSRYAKWLYDGKLIGRMIDPHKAFTNEFLPK